MKRVFFVVKNCLYLSDFTWKNAAGWRSNVSALVFFRWWHAFNSKACKCLSMGRVFLKRRKWLHWLDLLTAPYRWFARWPMLSELHVLRRKCTKRGSPRPATPTMHLCLQHSHLSVFYKLRWRQETWARLRNRGPLWPFLFAAWSKVEIRGLNVRFTNETSWGSRWKWSFSK